MRRFAMMLRTLAALSVLLALPAQSAVWYKNCNTTGGAVQGINAGAIACAPLVSNIDDTVILGVGVCENVDFGLVEDSNGDGTGASALTVTLQWCPVSQDDATVNTNALRDAACVDYASGTLTGDGALQGAGVPSGYIRGNVGGTFAGDPKVWARCNP